MVYRIRWLNPKVLEGGCFNLTAVPTINMLSKAYQEFKTEAQVTNKWCSLLLSIEQFLHYFAFECSLTCVGDIVHNYGSLSAAVVHRSKGVIPEKGGVKISKFWKYGDF